MSEEPKEEIHKHYSLIPVEGLFWTVLLIGAFWGPPIWRYIDSLATCHGGK